MPKARVSLAQPTWNCPVCHQYALTVLWTLCFNLCYIYLHIYSSWNINLMLLSDQKFPVATASHTFSKKSKLFHQTFKASVIWLQPNFNVFTSWIIFIEHLWCVFPALSFTTTINGLKKSTTLTYLEPQLHLNPSICPAPSHLCSFLIVSIPTCCNALPSVKTLHSFRTQFKCFLLREAIPYRSEPESLSLLFSPIVFGHLQSMQVYQSYMRANFTLLQKVYTPKAVLPDQPPLPYQWPAQYLASFNNVF